MAVSNVYGKHSGGKRYLSMRGTLPLLYLLIISSSGFSGEKADFAHLPLSPRPPSFSTRGDLVSLTNTSSVWIFSLSSGLTLSTAGYTLIDPDPMTIVPAPIFTVRVDGRDIPSNLWKVAPVMDDSGSAILRMRYSEGSLNLAARLWLTPLEDGRILARLRVTNLSLKDIDAVVSFPTLYSLSYENARIQISAGYGANNQSQIPPESEIVFRISKMENPLVLVVTASPWSSAFYLFASSEQAGAKLIVSNSQNQARAELEFAGHLKTLQSIYTGEVTLGLTKGDNMSVWSELNNIGLLK